MVTRLSRSISRQSAQQLFEEACRNQGKPPERTAARVAAYIIACAVHATSLAILALGIWITLRYPLL
jgi:hypothetical protein